MRRNILKWGKREEIKREHSPIGTHIWYRVPVVGTPDPDKAVAALNAHFRKSKLHPFLSAGVAGVEGLNKLVIEVVSTEAGELSLGEGI